MEATPITTPPRRSGRLSASLLRTAKPAQAINAPAPMEEVTRDAPPFERLLATNPAFALLVQTLDLEEIGTAYLPAPKPEPLPELLVTPPQATADTPKLQRLAAKVFAPGNSYPLRTVLDRLIKETIVTEERASKGLAMMEAQGVLSRTLSNEYYLTESTPF